MDATTSLRRSAGGARARWVARVLLTTASILLPIERVGAQTDREPGAEDPQRLEAVLERISPDQRLRLEAGAPRVRLEGRYAGTADARLALVTDDGVVHTRLGEINRVWTQGRSTGKGALIGGVAGLVIGATYGALISGVTCAESSCTTLGVAAGVGGIGAAGGAAVGALVGLAIPSWKLRFP
jgi:hypothetical protein